MESFALRSLLFLPGTFAPAVVALLLAYRREGRQGTDALLARITVWRVGVGWYVFALGYLATVKLVAALAHRLIVGDWPAFGGTPVYLLFAAALLSAPFQAGEEIGWRGYALPALGRHMGLRAASVALGVIWAAWHVPLFLLPGTDVQGQPFIPFMLAVTALSVAMAFLWARTGGSLLLVMLMHAATNNTTGIVPSYPPTEANRLIPLLTTVILWAGAAYFLARMPRAGET